MKTLAQWMLSPVRLANFLIRVQETKPYHFQGMLLFALFTGIFRGLEELLFFGIKIKNSEVFTFIHFYLSLGFILTMVLSLCGKLEWKKVNNAVVVGIFLGIFPPLIDKLFNPSSDVFYGFYFLWNLREVPWFGYKPEFNFPMGECITIWLSIFFSGYYVAYKTRSPWRSLAAATSAYVGFITVGSLLPMLVTRIVVGPVETVANARDYSEGLLRSVVYYNAFAQMVLATLAYMVIRPRIFRLLIARSVHSLPFLVMVLLGAAVAGTPNGETWLVFSLFFWGGWVTIIQNQFFDLKDDRSKNPEGIEVHDVNFINIVYFMALAAIFLTGARYVLPLLISFGLTFLYNYPFYRGKKKFPTNLKIEGMWGFSAYIGGVLTTNSGQHDSVSLSIGFLVFGGWSLVSALKDAKDVRHDATAGAKTLYLVLMARGLSFRAAHRSIGLLSFFCFLVAPVFFLNKGQWLAGSLLGLLTLVAMITLSRFAPSRRWFIAVLSFVGAYFAILLVLLLTAQAGFR